MKHEHPTFVLDTPGLWIRPLGASDERLYCELYTDPVTLRFIGVPLSYDRAVRSFMIALAAVRREPPRRLFLTVVEKSTQEAIGICSVQRFEADRRRAEAGIILRPAAHDRGYAREAFAAVISRAFAVLPVDEVWVQFSVDHLAARRVAAGIGLSRRDAAAAGDTDPAKQVWSARRQSWCHKAARQ